MGRPVFEEIPLSQETGLSRDVYALLAQANLLRMRGCWTEAVDCCMAAMRLAPESSSAMSLLGDIYENQGRYDDAAQWYRMALDVNPDSPADRLKLDLLLRQRRLPETAADSVAAKDTPNNHPAVLWQRLRQPESALRYGSFVAAALLFMVVGLAYASTHRKSALASLGLVPEQEVKLQPVIVPPDTPGSSDSQGTLRDSAEQGVLDTLRAAPDLSAQGISVTDVASDPRAGRLEITFALTTPSASLTRATILQLTLRVLQATASLPATQSASVFSGRCLAVNGTGSDAATLIFLGDLPRAALPMPETSLTDLQVQHLFVSPWWSPQIPN